MSDGKRIYGIMFYNHNTTIAEAATLLGLKGRDFVIAALEAFNILEADL